MVIFSTVSYHKLPLLAYLGAYGAHMFAFWVCVGHGNSKTFFSRSITLQLILLGLS
jgi:hypothetical protein